MTVDILICTFNERINNVSNILLPYNKSINYKISHQISTSASIHIPDELIRPDVEIQQFNGIGLSFNRNNALYMAKNDICIIADDDVVYNIKDIEKIISIFQENNIDILIGKIKTYKEEPQYKNYSSKIKKLSWLDIGSVSSIEIAFKRESIINNHIIFDTNFGLKGHLYQKGEEAVFLADCLKKNLTIVYYPIFIVKHHYFSSGKISEFNQSEIEYWGALSYRIFGHLSYLAMCFFMIKHHSAYHRKMSTNKYITYFLGGINHFKSNRNA